MPPLAERIERLVSPEGELRCGILLGAVAGSLAVLALIGAPSGEDRQQQTAAALLEWQAAMAADERALGGLRRAVMEGTSALAGKAAAMQARIVHLDALIERMVAQAPITEIETVFPSPLAVGGPEPALGEEEDPIKALVAATASLDDQIRDRWSQLTVLEDLLTWRELDAARRPEGWPVRDAYISSHFGMRIDPFTGRRAPHYGMDFAGREGTPITAVASGLVIWSGFREGYGEVVDIDHGDHRVTRYAHNKENLVAAGDVVSRGQIISRMGATGRATGPHLHFELLREGRQVSPLGIIQAND